MTEPVRRAGHRTIRASRGPDRVMVVAAIVPLLTALVLVLVPGRDGTDRFGVREEPTAPTSVPASVTTLICPGGAGRTFLSSAGDGGQVTLRSVEKDSVGEDGKQSSDPKTRSVASNEVARLAQNRAPQVITGEGPVAAGLVASRFELPFTASECREPDPELWFTGVGAGARYSSVLEMVNPDEGPAIVDIAVYGRRGQVDAPQLRGVAVPARGSMRIDLARVLPRRDELALRVGASRGRVQASISGRLDRLDGGKPSVDWLPGQPSAMTTNRLLGVDDGAGQRTLVLANPGDTEARATIRLITPDSVFAPSDSKPIVVPPGRTLRVDAGPLLRAANARGVIGVEVEASLPLTVALRSLVSDDLSFLAPGSPVDEEAALVIPTGSKRLLLSGATGSGSVAITSTDARGGSVREKVVEVSADRGNSVGLPDSASLVRIEPRDVSIEASIVRFDAGDAKRGRRGTVVLRLRDLMRESLVPGVRPGPPS